MKCSTTVNTDQAE